MPEPAGGPLRLVARDNRPVLPQQEDPQRAQRLDAAHFSDVIVRQVEEN